MVVMDRAFGDRRKKNKKKKLPSLFFVFLTLVSIEEMLWVETVGGNEQWLQNVSVMTDEVKELLSL